MALETEKEFSRAPFGFAVQGPGGRRIVLKGEEWKHPQHEQLMDNLGSPRFSLEFPGIYGGGDGVNFSYYTHGVLIYSELNGERRVELQLDGTPIETISILRRAEPREVEYVDYSNC